MALGIEFKAALRATGLEVIPGHHVWNEDLEKYSEKQSDLNVALSLMADAEDGKTDVALLLSADSDQAATARSFRIRHPAKKLLVVAPPTQNVPKKAIPFVSDHFALTRREIDDAALPEVLQGAMRFTVRPDAYAPLAWWKHHNDR